MENTQGWCFPWGGGIFHVDPSEIPGGGFGGGSQSGGQLAITVWQLSTQMISH